MIHLAATEIPRSFFWKGDHLLLLDQTRLPLHQEWLRLTDLESVCEAIRSLKVRGAPAIGVAAAYGAVLEMRRRVIDRTSMVGSGNAAHQTSSERMEAAEFLRQFSSITADLRATRPTAVNLFHCLERMDQAASQICQESNFEAASVCEALEKEAISIHEEDEQLCARMGELGSELIPDKAGILTHCNAGAMATGGIGTALGAIYTAHLSGKKVHVFADETRPLLQGSRITSWELQKAGIPVHLITDSMAATVLADGRADLVIVGADRIASNGDTANKIGTLGLAILAKHFGVPFYVVAPSTTLDVSLDDGMGIPIEQRNADEVRQFLGHASAPTDIDVFNPAFDVTPGNLIAAIVTESGIHRPPYDFRSLSRG